MLPLKREPLLKWGISGLEGCGFLIRRVCRLIYNSRFLQGHNPCDVEGDLVEKVNWLYPRQLSAKLPLYFLLVCIDFSFVR